MQHSTVHYTQGIFKSDRYFWIWIVRLWIIWIFSCWSNDLWSTPPDSIQLKLIWIKLSWIYLGVYMKASQSDWAINLIIWVHKNITTDRKCAVAPVRDLRHEETRFLLDPLVSCAYLVKRQLEGALYISYSFLHKSESLVACKLLEFDRCSDGSACSSSPSRYLSSYKVSQPLLGKAEPGGSLVPGPDIHEEHTSTSRCSPPHSSPAPWWCHPCEKPVHPRFRLCCHKEPWQTASEGNRRQKMWEKGL